MTSRKVQSAKQRSKVDPKRRDEQGHGTPSGSLRLQSDASGRIVEFFSKEDVCPVCKSDRYLNPNLRLLVSKCYHRMCESCIDRIFTLGQEPCPVCGDILRKRDFSPQTFENLGVEKEVVIRRRVARTFNKREEDFVDLRAFNDYLQTVEDITFNLINGLDLAETEDRIRAFAAENQDVIAYNAARSARDLQRQKQIDDATQKQREARKAHILQSEAQEMQEDQRLKVLTLRHLEESNADAGELVSRQRAAARRQRADRDTTYTGDAGAGATPAAPSGPTAHEQDVAVDDYADLLETIAEGYSLDPYESTEDDKSRVGGYRADFSWLKDTRSAVAGLFA